jgi:hypothetical protein
MLSSDERIITSVLGLICFIFLSKVSALLEANGLYLRNYLGALLVKLLQIPQHAYSLL